MNWERGLFRLWLVVSIAWATGIVIYALIAFIAYHQLPTVDQFWTLVTAPACNSGQEHPAWCSYQSPPVIGPLFGEWWVMLVLALLPPPLLLGFGLGVRWSVQGFRGRRLP